MTERTDSAIATAEAILKLLEDNEIKPSDGLTDKTDNYARALLIVRTYAASLRLHQPPKRGRRPNVSKVAE